MIAIQHKISGQLIDLCETRDQAQTWLSYSNELELVDTNNSSKVEVIYTELGGPWGYGHQETSFETYGALLTCIRRLYAWMKNEARTWGPDPRDIKDYFKNCRLYINGEDKFDWFYDQYNKLNLKELYV